MTAPARETLRVIYAEVLGLARVDVHEGFFDAGGDSVLAVQVVARAREAGLALSVRDVFDHQTVAALAAVAREMTADAPADAVPLVAVSADQLAEFEDDEVDGVNDGDETGWETVK